MTMEFQIEQFKVKQLSPKGLWIVTADNLSDLGMLFLRAQEFYESGNPAFVGKPFSINEYIKWYAANVADPKNVFSYFEDFQGFNIPKDVLDEFQKTVFPDPNRDDIIFASIVQAVRVLQKGDFYLVGAKTGHVSNMLHETAHGMWYLVPEYRQKALTLITQLGDTVYEELFKLMVKEGYSANVAQDEINAYMSTGLLSTMEEYEHMREPFMRLFAKYHKKFVAKRKRSKPKPKVIVEPVQVQS